MSLPDLLDFTRMTGDLMKAMRACRAFVRRLDDADSGAQRYPSWQAHPHSSQFPNGFFATLTMTKSIGNLP